MKKYLYITQRSKGKRQTVMNNSSCGPKIFCLNVKEKIVCRTIITMKRVSSNFMLATNIESFQYFYEKKSIQISTKKPKRQKQYFFLSIFNFDFQIIHLNLISRVIIATTMEI